MVRSHTYKGELVRRNDVDRGSLVSRRDPQISRNIGTGGSPISRKFGDGVPNFPENWGRGSLISWDPQFYVTPALYGIAMNAIAINFSWLMVKNHLPPRRIFDQLCHFFDSV